MKNLIIIFFTATLIMPTWVLAADVIGQVLISKSVVIVNTMFGALRTLAKGCNDYLVETVLTAGDRLVVMQMAGNSKFSLRPQSEVPLEKFNQSENYEKALFRFLKGGLRAMSDAIGKTQAGHYRGN